MGDGLTLLAVIAIVLLIVIAGGGGRNIGSEYPCGGPATRGPSRRVHMSVELVILLFLFGAGMLILLLFMGRDRRP